MNVPATRPRGFTLLELIVAAGILALIAVFSWRGLDTLLRERDAIAVAQENIDLMQRAFARIERDATLAKDAQIDDANVLRLVAATGEAAGRTRAPGVEYRLVDGALVRRVDGSDPIVVLAGVTRLVVEVWTPGPNGAWVRVKGPATEVAAPVPVAPAGGAAPASEAGQASPPNAAAAPAFPGAVPNAAQNTPAPTPGASAQPVIAAATGVRFAIVRGDGNTVIRTLLVGSGG